MFPTLLAAHTFSGGVLVVSAVVAALGLISIWMYLRKRPKGTAKCAEPIQTVTDGPCCVDVEDEPVTETPSVNQNPKPAEIRSRPRDHGLSIGTYRAGTHNAITDVKGVKVGHSTVKHGEGKLVAGSGPARTGVTAIIPHDGDIWNERVSAGMFVLNGNGVVTGLDWVKELGLIDGPILLTNTLSVGSVFDAAVAWMLKRYPEIGITDDTYLPIVGECDDGSLNDIRGRHVKEAHVFEALDSAHSGPVKEGAVGAGTGMISFRFKGGIGTSSRVLPAEDGGYTVGVLVNTNFGDRHQLRIDGVPVGKLLERNLSTSFRDGSICIVVATDAALSPQQLERLAKRAAMGLARTGAIAKNGSGDFIVAFSTSRLVKRGRQERTFTLPELNNELINPLFEATVEATEEAIVNALFMAETTVGRDGNEATGLPVAETLALLREHKRIS